MGVAWLEVTHWAWKRAEKCPVVHDPKLEVCSFPFLSPQIILSPKALQVYLFRFISFLLLQLLGGTLFSFKVSFQS